MLTNALRAFLIKIVSKLSWNELLTNVLRALVSMTQFNKVHPNTPGIGAHC